MGVITLSPTLLDTGVVHASNKEGWERRLSGNGLLYIHSPIRCVFGHQSEKHIEVAITPNKYQPHSSAYLGIPHLFNFVPWPALGRRCLNCLEGPEAAESSATHRCNVLILGASIIIQLLRRFLSRASVHAVRISKTPRADSSTEVHTECTAALRLIPIFAVTPNQGRRHPLTKYVVGSCKMKITTLVTKSLFISIAST